MSKETHPRVVGYATGEHDTFAKQFPVRVSDQKLYEKVDRLAFTRPRIQTWPAFLALFW